VCEKVAHTPSALKLHKMTKNKGNKCKLGLIFQTSPNTHALPKKYEKNSFPHTIMEE